MSRTPEELLKLASSFDNVATKALVVTAAKKEKKKLDPKAKVRNRGTVCVPAEQAKDKKDHFPINDEGQARNALARVQQLSSAPWYKGSLEGLKALVARKVKAKYPKIDVGGKKEKKSSDYYDDLLMKIAQDENVQTLQEQTITGQPPPRHQAVTQTEGVDAKAVQQALFNMRFNLGQTGPERNGVDGDWGNVSETALKQYMQNLKVPPQTPTKTVKEFLAKGGAGTPPWQQGGQEGQGTYDVKAITDAWRQTVGGLTDYQSQSEQQQITADNAPEVKQYMNSARDWANATLKLIATKLQDAKATDQEKKQAQTLDASIRKVLVDVNEWFRYLETFPVATMGKATADLIAFEKQFAKYAQQPKDPKWVAQQQKQQPTQQQNQQPPAQTQNQTPVQTQVPVQTPTQTQTQPQAQTQTQTQPVQQKAQPQFSEAQLKGWKDWLKNKADETKSRIEGRTFGWDLKSLTKKSSDELEMMKVSMNDDLERLNRFKAAGLEQRLDEEHRNYLISYQSQIRIIIKRIEKYIERKEAEERMQTRRRR